MYGLLLLILPIWSQSLTSSFRHESVNSAVIALFLLLLMTHLRLFRGLWVCKSTILARSVSKVT